MLLAFFGLPAHSVSNNTRVPVIHYHSNDLDYDSTGVCSYATHSGIALEEDLKIMREEGFTVLPVYWLTEWAVGDRDGSTLPPWVVGITLSDGFNADWYDVNHLKCGYVKSARRLLLEFKDAVANAQPGSRLHGSPLPPFSPHASSFVIASPVARRKLDDSIYPAGYGTPNANEYFTDDWWLPAQQSGLMEIYNHSTDHDHPSIVGGPFYDTDLQVYIPTGGGSNGQGNFARIDTEQEIRDSVVKAAQFIESKIGAWPDLFMYPASGWSPELRDVYFPQNSSEHKTYAAFLGYGPDEETYLRRGLNRWFLRVFEHRGSWSTPARFREILLNSLRGDEHAVGRFYWGLLSRVGDSGGYGYWLGNLRAYRCSGPTLAALHGYLDGLIQAFVYGPEFQNLNLSNEGYARAMYRGILKRDPDAGGLAYWTGQLNQGLSRETLRQYFVYSGEFAGNTLARVYNESCTS